MSDQPANLALLKGIEPQAPRPASEAGRRTTPPWQSREHSSDDDPAPFRRRLLRYAITAFPIVLSVALLAFLVWREWSALVDLVGQKVPAPAILAIAFLLSLLPVYVCVVQNVTRNRQSRKLDSLRTFPVATTSYYDAARLAVDNVKIMPVGGDYAASISVYATLLMIGFSIIALALATPDLMRLPNVVLGGWMTLTLPATGSDEAKALIDYQTKTFVVGATAFIGAYVYSLTRLLDRINNNDLYPISLYYYAVRCIIAVFVAAVLRHVAYTFFLPNTSALILVGFVVGMAPDSFIVAMMRRGFQMVKISAVRNDPANKEVPQTLPLLMIDDLGREKIDRLNELGIDNAQILSRQNPLLLWPRLPYDLALLVDWMGQAHLYALVGADKLTALRSRYVRDSFDLELRLSDPDACGAVKTLLGLESQEGPCLVTQLNKDPAFVRLKQVREALAAQH
jgi:hypothetical protein